MLNRCSSSAPLSLASGFRRQYISAAWRVTTLTQLPSQFSSFPAEHAANAGDKTNRKSVTKIRIKGNVLTIETPKSTKPLACLFNTLARKTLPPLTSTLAANAEAPPRLRAATSSPTTFPTALPLLHSAGRWAIDAGASLSGTRFLHLGFLCAAVSETARYFHSIGV